MITGEDIKRLEEENKPIVKTIEDFSKRCADKGHYFSPHPFYIGVMYCEACGEFKAPLTAR